MCHVVLFPFFVLFSLPWAVLISFTCPWSACCGFSPCVFTLSVVSLSVFALFCFLVLHLRSCLCSLLFVLSLDFKCFCISLLLFCFYFGLFFLVFATCLLFVISFSSFLVPPLACLQSAFGSFSATIITILLSDKSHEIAILKNVNVRGLLKNVHCPSESIDISGIIL